MTVQLACASSLEVGEDGKFVVDICSKEGRALWRSEALKLQRTRPTLDFELAFSTPSELVTPSKPV